MRRAGLSGQSFTEYAFGIALVALVAVVGLVNLSKSINNGFTSILSKPSASTVKASASAVGGVATGAQAASAVSLKSSNLSRLSAADLQNTHSTVVQVSGSNGGSDTVQANSQKLMDLAAKYQDSDPALANLILQLAQKGYSVANAMNHYDADRGIEDSQFPLGGPNGVCPQYNSLWNQVQQSAEYGNLSADDQALVKLLAEDSYSRASDLFFAGAMTAIGKTATTNVRSSAQVVNSNSHSIRTCSDDACNSTPQ